MSVSVLVHCPSCHAEGSLADPALFGKAISCPVCQQVFVVPLPTEAEIPPVTEGPAPLPPTVSEPLAQGEVPPTIDPMVVAAAEPVEVPVELPTPIVQQDAPTATVTPEVGVPVSLNDASAAPAQFGAAAPTTTSQPMPIAVAIAIPTSPPVASQPPWPVATVPVTPAPPVTGDFLLPAHPPMEGPVPAFMAPAPIAGPAEEMFAQSLPTPGVRGSVQPPKMPSKNVQMVIIGCVSVILLFATIMFLAGDPMRGPKPKLAKTTSKNKPVEDEAPSDESIENVFDRINATSKPKDK